MSASQKIPFSRVSPLRYAAAQQILGMAAMTSQQDEDFRPAPAKVYPAVSAADSWVVEAPASANAPGKDCRIFAGATALLKALEYAHCTYGSALYLSR